MSVKPQIVHLQNSVGVLKGMWIFQINIRSAFGLHVPHFILGLAHSGLGLGLDLVSSPKVLVLSGAWGHDLGLSLGGLYSTFPFMSFPPFHLSLILLT